MLDLSSALTNMLMVSPCLAQEWDSLREWGFLEGTAFNNSKTIQLLGMWRTMAKSDLMLAEALAGHELSPSQSIADVVPPLILLTPGRGFFLSQ